MPKWIVDEQMITENERDHHQAKGFGDSETAIAGAMTMKQQIDRLRAAQIVQGNWRRAHFPPNTEIPDDFIPPEYGVDEMDAIVAARKVINGLALAQARQEAVDQRKAKEQAQTEPEPEPEPEPQG